MNISMKICDMCDTCVYKGEYKIIEGDIICFMCEYEKQEETEECEEETRVFPKIQG